MPKHKHAEGSTAVLDREARTFSVDDALRLVYAVEDALLAVLRVKPRDKTIRGALKGVATLREDLEDRSDAEAAREAREEMRRTGEKPIPWEDVKRGLGL